MAGVANVGGPSTVLVSLDAMRVRQSFVYDAVVKQGNNIFEKMNGKLFRCKTIIIFLNVHCKKALLNIVKTLKNF